jgi:uncharacterized membrane protein
MIVSNHKKDAGALNFTLHQWLLVSSAFSCFLLLLRITVTGSVTYMFLPWNLFLAFVPYWISQLLVRRVSLIENKFKLFVLLGLWTLFLPNTFYIITDIYHLTHISSAPEWFDLLLLFSFAWNGILCGVISLRRVEVIAGLFNPKYKVPLVFIAMWLAAFGIYIGRFLRFNSWDVFTDPFSLAAEIGNMIFHPIQNLYAWGMTFGYALFMSLLYISIKKLRECF